MKKTVIIIAVALTCVIMGALIGVSEETGPMLSYAWVGGSIWGGMFGGLLAAIIGSVIFGIQWKKTLVNKAIEGDILKDTPHAQLIAYFTQRF